MKLSGWIWKWGLLRSFRLRNQAAPLKLNLQDRLFHLNPVIPPEKSGGSVEASWVESVRSLMAVHSA